MARHEEDREDLMREAVALVRRIELRLEGEAEPVTAGWRSTGWFSIYFGQDPVWHFDEAGRLRRAYVAGFLYRTQGITLARLERHRSDAETVLVRVDLAAEPLAEFLAAMRLRLHAARASLALGHVDVLRAEGDAAALLGELSSTLDRIATQTEALAPAIARRR